MEPGNAEIHGLEEGAQGRRGRGWGRLSQIQLGSPDSVGPHPRLGRDIDDWWPRMRRAALERRNARDRKRVGSEREMVHEPGKVDEVTSSGVLNVPRQRQGVELLGDVLIDGIDGEP